MKFGHLFEFHKIPEWYTEYVHYKDLRDQIDQFKKFKKEGLVVPLNGYYTINQQGQIYCIDFIKNFKTDIKDPSASRRDRDTKTPQTVPRRSSVEEPQSPDSYIDTRPGLVPGAGMMRSASLFVDPIKASLDQFDQASGKRTSIHVSPNGSDMNYDEPNPKITKSMDEEEPVQSTPRRLGSHIGSSERDQYSPLKIPESTGIHSPEKDTMLRTQTLNLSALRAENENIVVEMNMSDDDEEDVESMILSRILKRKMSDLTGNNLTNDNDPEHASIRHSVRVRPVMQLKKNENIETLHQIHHVPTFTPSVLGALGDQTGQSIVFQDDWAQDLIPEMNKKDIDILMKEEVVETDTLIASEELTAIWISAYLDEINRVETFFNTKLEELINQFIHMQDKFRLKSELYETEKHAKEIKQMKKQKEMLQGQDEKKELLNQIITNWTAPQTQLLADSMKEPASPLAGSNRPINYSALAPSEINNSQHLFVSAPQRFNPTDSVAAGHDSDGYGMAVQVVTQVTPKAQRRDNSLPLTPTARNSFIRVAQTRQRQNSGAGIIPDRWKYKNRQDLQRYYKEVEGRETLDTFLVPDVGAIQRMLSHKDIIHDRRIKDEFDHMINWQRVFESIWMQIRWLKSYNQINELALKKILKKFMKNYFLIKDNTIKKKLESIVDTKEFKKKESDKGKGAKDLKMLSDGLLAFYADMFYQGKKNSARKILDAQHNKVRVMDAVIMSFFAGMILITLVFFVFFLWFPQVGEQEKPWVALSSGIETYIFTFVIVFIIVSTGVNIQIFRKFGINYTFIFEIDTKHKIIHHQLYRTGLVFGFMWVLCFVWETATIKLQIGFFDEYATWTLVLLLMFLFACLNPIAMFYRSTRIQILYTLGNILIAPFGLVRFRHFFLADVITSITTPLQETMIIYCYFAGPDQDWKNETKVNFNEECVGAHKLYTFLAFLPYWFRFCQCLRKYKDSEQKIHLVNAGKYFSDLCVPLAQLWVVKYDFDTAFWIWVAVHTIASSYSYAWDIYMDWGLLRSKELGTYGLRPKINYHAYFYYYAIVSDFILRFFWIVPIFRLGSPDSAFNTFQIMTFISIFLELFRRAQWSLIRVENEQNNNLEAYRTIPIIPPIVENEENQNMETSTAK